MADNIATTPGSGATIAADDVGGILHQRVKLGIGADGTAVDAAPPADAQTAAPLIAAGLQIFDRTAAAYNRLSAPTADGFLEGRMVAAGGMLYNGSTWDRARGNLDGTLLASAARTTTASTSLQTNHNARGVLLFLNITVASGTGGLVTRVRGQDPITGNHVHFNVAPTAILATGNYGYVLYPGADAAAAGAGTGHVLQFTSGPLPRLWIAQVVHGDASSYTYSLSYQTIV